VDLIGLSGLRAAGLGAVVAAVIVMGGPGATTAGSLQDRPPTDAAAGAPLTNRPLPVPNRGLFL
jgi:hypothetical protein